MAGLVDWGVGRWQRAAPQDSSSWKEKRSPNSKGSRSVVSLRRFCSGELEGSPGRLPSSLKETAAPPEPSLGTQLGCSRPLGRLGRLEGVPRLGLRSLGKFLV